MSQHNKLVVGVDFGTTTTVVAVSAFFWSPHIEYIALSQGDDVSLAPSRIACKVDNPFSDSNFPAWGPDVKPEMKACSWTKLLLYPGVEDNTDIKNLESFAASGIFHKPEGWSAEDVVREIFVLLYQRLCSKFRTSRTFSIYFNKTPMKFIFTRPETWPDGNKLAKIAEKAGFGSRSIDSTVSTMTEPEAAAYAVFLQTELGLEAGDRVLICDLGGGTMDFQGFYILNVSPVSVRKIGNGNGACWGGTTIDRNFYWMLAGLLNGSVPGIDLRHGSDLMEGFEKMKTTFDGVTENDEFSQFQEEIRKLTKSTLPLEAIRNMFDPVIDQIISMIQGQLEAENGNSYPYTNKLVFVGGLSSSLYVQRALRNCFHAFGKLGLIFSPAPQKAVATGAVYRGYEESRPEIRRSPQHYGVEKALPQGYFERPLNPTGEITSTVDWFINKDEEYNPQFSESREVTLFHHWPIGPLKKTIPIYTCDTVPPPSLVDDAKIVVGGVVCVDLGKLKLEDLPRIRTGHEQGIIRIDCMIRVAVGPEPHSLMITVDTGGLGIGQRIFHMRDFELKTETC